MGYLPRPEATCILPYFCAIVKVRRGVFFIAKSAAGAAKKNGK